MYAPPRERNKYAAGPGAEREERKEEEEKAANHFTAFISLSLDFTAEGCHRRCCLDQLSALTEALSEAHRRLESCWIFMLRGKRVSARCHQRSCTYDPRWRLSSDSHLQPEGAAHDDILFVPFKKYQSGNDPS